MNVLMYQNCLDLALLVFIKSESCFEIQPKTAHPLTSDAESILTIVDPYCPSKCNCPIK